MSGIGDNGISITSPLHLKIINNHLYVSGGVKYYDRYRYDGRVSIYDGQTWTNTNNAEIADAAGIRFRDVVHTVPHPDDPYHIYAFTLG